MINFVAAVFLMSIVIIPLIISEYKQEKKRETYPPYFGYKVDYGLVIGLTVVVVVLDIIAVLMIIFGDV